MFRRIVLPQDRRHEGHRRDSPAESRVVMTTRLRESLKALALTATSRWIAWISRRAGLFSMGVRSARSSARRACKVIARSQWSGFPAN